MSIQALKNIRQKIEQLPNHMEQELDISENDLNIILTEREIKALKVYDPSMRYRSEVISKGYYIHKMIAVYYQGWECDFWAFIVSKDGKKYKAVSDHGGWEFKEL